MINLESGHPRYIDWHLNKLYSHVQLIDNKFEVIVDMHASKQIDHDKIFNLTCIA